MKITLALILIISIVCVINNVEARFGYGFGGYGHGLGYGYGSGLGYGYGSGLGYGYGSGLGYGSYGYGSPYYNSYYSSYYPSYLYGKRDASTQGNRVECFYYVQDRFLNCRNQTSVVECPAFGNFPREFRDIGFYGVGSLALNQSLLFSNLESESIGYSLYPRLIENERWLNNTLLVNGKFLSFSLYYSRLNENNGIRVLDLECYGDLIRLFQFSNFNHIISLEQDSTYQFDSANITLAGDIRVIN